MMASPIRRGRITWPAIGERAAAIVNSYETGLSLRQLFYRLVSVLAIPNTTNAYKELSRHTAEARVESVVYALFDYDAAGEGAARAVHRELVEHPPEVPISFERLAVTADQIAEWGLQTRPTKRSDPEAAKFRTEAVEVDAIPPDKLLALVEKAIDAPVDAGAWELEKRYEQSERELLGRLAANGKASA